MPGEDGTSSWRGRMPKLTVSIIEADIGGFVGHSEVHPEIDPLWASAGS